MEIVIGRADVSCCLAAFPRRICKRPGGVCFVREKQVIEGFFCANSCFF